MFVLFALAVLFCFGWVLYFCLRMLLGLCFVFRFAGLIVFFSLLFPRLCFLVVVCVLAGVLLASLFSFFDDSTVCFPPFVFVTSYYLSLPGFYAFFLGAFSLSWLVRLWGVCLLRLFALASISLLFVTYSLLFWFA